MNSKIKLFFIVLIYTITSVLEVYSQNIQAGQSPFMGNIYHMEGNLGIGTSNPSRKIEVYSTDSVIFRMTKVLIHSNNNKCNYDFLNIWELQNTNNLVFKSIQSCGNANTVTRMTLTNLGQLSLGEQAPDNSAVFQANTTERGFLLPRLTTIQKNAIQTPANSLLVYDTDQKMFSYFEQNSNTWQLIPNKEFVESFFVNYLSLEYYNAQPSSTITSQQIRNWDNAYSWGNHAGLYKSISWLPSWNEISDKPSFSSVAFSGSYTDLTNTPVFNTANWETAYSWGNHAQAGYITASSNDVLTNKSGNISMWTNDAGYLTSENTGWERSKYSTNLKNSNDNVGIGTENPQKKLHIASNLAGIRLDSKAQQPSLTQNIMWDIENMDTLLFRYSTSQNTNPVSAFKISNNGTVVANKFVGDGSGLTNLPNSFWNKNNNDIYYTAGKVGVGTTTPSSTLHLKSVDNKPTLKFESVADDGSMTQDDDLNKSNVPVYWEMQQNGSKLSFSFNKNGSITNDMFYLYNSLGNVVGDVSKMYFKGQINSESAKINTTLETQNATITNNLQTKELTVNNMLNGNNAVFTGTLETKNLKINGVPFTSLQIWQKSNTNSKIYYNQGNVGIGTDNPLEKLQIGEKFTFHSGGNKVIGYNFYYSGGQDRRIAAGPSSQIRFTQSGDISFRTSPEGDSATVLSYKYFTFLNNGNVGIGKNDPTNPFEVWKDNTQLLKVNASGYLYCRELIVQKNGNFPDYVFEPNYNLLPLKELEIYIIDKKHLPDMPTAQEVEQNGIEVANLTTVLVKKVEELTLYTIEQQKQIDQQKQLIEKQQQQIDELKRMCELLINDKK